MTKFTVRKFKANRPKLRQRVGGAVNISQTNLSILLLGVIIFMGLTYLFYINQTATGGFDIKGMETEISKLKKENKQLELKVAELQSLGTIEATSQELEMVATSYIEYLPAVGTAVAQR